MMRRSILALLCCGAPLVTAAGASASQGSVGTPEQIAWVRSASTRFVTAELTGDGAAACTILNSPMRATIRHRSCEQRWNAKLSRMLHTPGVRAQLRAERRAIAAARVVVSGDQASINLPAPLIAGAPNHLKWTENCWMVEG
jgi:hypothetical protein